MALTAASERVGRWRGRYSPMLSRPTTRLAVKASARNGSGPTDCGHQAPVEPEAQPDGQVEGRDAGSGVDQQQGKDRRG